MNNNGKKISDLNLKAKLSGKELIPLAYDGSNYSTNINAISDYIKNINSNDNVFDKENRIYRLTQDLNLNGKTITLPENCTLDFAGSTISNGTIVLNNTLLLGDIRFNSNCNVEGSIKNDTLLVDWFGAKNDGVTDNTAVLRRVIELAYNSTSNDENTFTKLSPIIKFNYGTYLVKFSLIYDEMNVKYGTFVFQGDGVVNTTIRFTGTDDSYLFYNKEVFAYTEFNNIRFVGTDKNNFMYQQASTSTESIPQSITFNSCRFGQFKTVINSEGNAMCSEITFNTCKIVYFPNTESELFIMNNLQAVNWRFFGTDIEQTHGTIFKIIQGTYISLYSCSIIPFEGIVISVPEEANADTFWLTNTPSIAMYSCRFEMRDNSQLMKIYTRAYLQFVFNTCGMGGQNINNSIGTHTIDISSPTGINQVKLIFNDCSNLLNYSYKVAATNNSYSGFVESHFNHCLFKINDIFEKSELPTISDFPAAPEGSPKFFVDGIYYGYDEFCKIRNLSPSIGYIAKSNSNEHFIANLEAEGSVRLDSTNFFKLNLYVGAISFNIRPSTKIRLYIYNTEADKIYGDFTIEPWVYFNQTVYVNKLVTDESGIVISIKNLDSSESSYISGHCEIQQTCTSINTLLPSNKLSALNEVQKGFIAYDHNNSRVSVWDGSRWDDVDGFTIALKKGSTEERPILTDGDIGYQYFDTTLGKPIYWHGNHIWKDSTSTEV